jgi:hypothetical protein
MISHKHKCIFIHIPKTGGQSVWRFFYGNNWRNVNNIKPGSSHHLNCTEELLNEYFVWTTVRNPYSRTVSLFKYLKKIRRISRKLSFNDFINYLHLDLLNLNHAEEKHPLGQIDFIESLIGSIENLDFVGRLENIQQDFNIVCDKIGIPQQQLPHTNATKHKHYTEYYDDETREIVAEKYAKDIEYFGYKFGE